MGGEQHWQAIYEKKAPDQVSWYRPHLERSLAFIRSAGLPRDARIVDVGSGTSSLVDDLLTEGYRNVAVIDIADSAHEVTRSRLGARASRVDWIVGDVTTPLLPDASVDFWHDRAVFHFLTEAASRAAYLAQVLRCVKPGGRVLVATFGPEGPERCSGLPVARYSADGIHDVFGAAFDKIDEAAEQHQTPAGTVQAFVYCFCRRVG